MFKDSINALFFFISHQVLKQILITLNYRTIVNSLCKNEPNLPQKCNYSHIQILKLVLGENVYHPNILKRQ
jgi:hypothetical protein